MQPFEKQLTEYRVIAVIGAGGKTGICRALTRGLPGSCVYTTTTHMFRPETDFVCLTEPSPAQLKAALERYEKIALCGPEAEPGTDKVGYPGEERYRLACSLADHVILEADGARGRQIKLHGEKEPVIPANAELVLAVASLEALGRPLKETVHREAYIRAGLGKAPDQPVTEADIALALARACRFHANTVPVLNCVTDRAAAGRIGALLQASFGLPAILVDRFGDGAGNGAFLESRYTDSLYRCLEAGFRRGRELQSPTPDGEVPLP